LWRVKSGEIVELRDPQSGSNDILTGGFNPRQIVSPEHKDMTVKYSA